MVSADAIEGLRRAADALDWMGARGALDQTLAEMAPEQTLALAEAVLRSGLPTFERNHPGETWPRRALDGQAGGEYPECAGPGGNNFAHGCEMLVDARARRDDPAACRALVVDAISTVIMGEMYAIWGADHPEEFRRGYNAILEGRELEGGDPRIGWSDHPKVQAAKRALWNDVADRLAAMG